MDSAFTFKALSYGLIGLFWITVLAVSLISMRKESRYDAPLKGLTGLTLAVISLCAFIALCMAHVQKAKLVEKLDHPTARVISENDLPQ
jgi:apolipoprotein N-acyltransferase